MTEHHNISDAHYSRINFAVERGLGAHQWTALSLMNGGLSGSFVYAIQVGDKKYAIKLDDADNDDLDLKRYYKNMQEAGQHKLSPKIHFSDAAHGVMLMEYVESKALPTPSPDSIAAFAKLLRSTHNDLDFEEWKSIDEILNIFHDKLPSEYKENELIKSSMAHAKNIMIALNDPDDLKSCHCDLNPRNLLFDGNNYLLVDWQGSCQQNFYFDLACCATFFYFFNEELCETFLHTYFERSATEVEKAKYYLMRVFADIYYGIIFITMPIGKGLDLKPLTTNEIDELPSYLGFMQTLGSGFIDLADAMTQQQFGYVFLKSAQDKITHEDYIKSLQTITTTITS